jgi:resolvase-like protein
MTDAAPASPDVTPGAALYLRVSTGRQAESDLSIPDQRRQITAYCLTKGWDVAAEFVEPGNTRYRRSAAGVVPKSVRNRWKVFGSHRYLSH